MSFTAINPLSLGVLPHHQYSDVALRAHPLLALASDQLLGEENFLRKETSLSWKEISSAKEKNKLVQHPNDHFAVDLTAHQCQLMWVGADNT